jgi:hypothetical protein
MRKQTVKALRKIINPSSAISRRVFRRLKKKYNALSSDEKCRFKTLGPMLMAKQELPLSTDPT